MNNEKKTEFRLDQSTASNGLFTVIERKPLSSLENNESLNFSNFNEQLNPSVDDTLKKKEDYNNDNNNVDNMNNSNNQSDSICGIYRLNSSQLLNENLDNTLSRISYVDEDVSSFFDSDKEEELYFDNDISTLGSCYSINTPNKIYKKKKTRNSINGIHAHGKEHINLLLEKNEEKKNSPFIHNKKEEKNNIYYKPEEGLNEDYYDIMNKKIKKKKKSAFLKDHYFKENVNVTNDDINIHSMVSNHHSDHSDHSNKSEKLLNEKIVPIKNNNEEKAIRLNKNIYREEHDQ
ncbi:hypothetical protein PFTANZ_00515 [Plasmodium falciparum Tanzania (2000708)]|uniref:Uncharacterized protein n=1 Tax=Plasmodium falciparum Tanzania (2000708) TaxID=1036725 RepID=A0A024WES8_PLAFA|nr:hypothetical protein PFTANZ_00515 [Plasmodium falciparum Tanzania (2000708)]